MQSQPTIPEFRFSRNDVVTLINDFLVEDFSFTVRKQSICNIESIFITEDGNEY